jgi:predicted ATP-grasp superfamily ATP-dependent carboligase
VKAFVTDGDQRPALAITRSLGRRGITVVVGEERPVCLASSSKYCASGVAYPSPYSQPERFDRFLHDFIVRERVDVVMPVSDVTTYAVARRRTELKRHSAVAAPSFESFDLSCDKWRLLQRASRCGISIPRTHLVEGLAGLMAVLPRMTYPAVVKPVRSRTLTSHGWIGAGVQYASCEEDLLNLYRTTDHLAHHPSLIQERIVGPGTGLFVLCERGQVRTAFAHRRLREKPPSGGVSVLSESIAVDPRLLAQAARLLGGLGWHGVAMLEYKLDRRTGRLVLMEVNGRFWGSLQLAVDAGVDFPFLSYQLAVGQALEPPAAYRVGITSRWLLGDLDNLTLRLSRRDLNLPEPDQSRFRAVIEFMKVQHYDVCSWKDPRPFIHELQRYVCLSAGSALRRFRRTAFQAGPWSAATRGTGTHGSA